MKLICEQVENVRYVTEAKESGKKDYFIEGIFMQGNIQNRNGRMYPISILQKEAERYMKETVKENRAYGELGHPQSPSINLDRVSHMIKELRQDGNNFYGRAKIMDTPMGNIVKNLMDEGASLGVSTRGMGSIKENKQGFMEVQDDFHLATVDIVTDPSGPNCFVNGIMENTEYYYDITAGNWKIAERLEETVKELKKEVSYKKPVDEAKALRIFENFIASLK